MGESHGGIGSVDALTAGSARAVHIDADIRRIQIDLDIIGKNRKDLDAGKRGVAALLIVGRGNANQTMDADLAAKHSIGVSAFDLECRLV